MIKRLLIANRGEIACRIIRTARHMGIHTIAVYSDADRRAQHVLCADESYRIGPAPSQASYLEIETLIQTAKKANADAIHPGYGFLSENADFARACLEQDLIFVGPPAATIALMGDKLQAKKTMEAANVPIIPGYHGAQQDFKTLKKAAEEIGLPVLLKAVAGGGGKGMRHINHWDDFETAYAATKREAKASFGNDALFIEKYLPEARHVELQMFSDGHKHHVHLFDRDCSIQRRHQKMIEEAPAPFLNLETRSAIAETGRIILESLDYLGAATIEFLVDVSGAFYFMEMNTRLQVEHPVTEKITGLDLVEWQLRIASGESLPLSQEAITHTGHAIEVRLCAENPSHGYLPSTGYLQYFKTPIEDAHLRVDTGVTEGDEITPHYDSMIAKIITYANTREEAILQMQEALRDTYLVGVHSNREFLLGILCDPDFKQGKLSTRFIEQHPELLNTPKHALSIPLIVMAAVYRFKQLQADGHDLARRSEDRYSPWFIRDGWQLNIPAFSIIKFWNDEEPLTITIYPLPEGDYEVEFQKTTYPVQIIWEDHEHVSMRVLDESICATFIADEHCLHVFHQGKQNTLALHSPALHSDYIIDPNSHLSSPMPGTIVEIPVTANQVVQAGDTLLTIEAMKMEHKITAPTDGKIRSIPCKVGDTVQSGVALIEFDPKTSNN